MKGRRAQPALSLGRPGKFNRRRAAGQELRTPGQVAVEDVGLPGEMEARVGLEEE